MNMYIIQNKNNLIVCQPPFHLKSIVCNLAKMPNGKLSDQNNTGFNNHNISD